MSKNRDKKQNKNVQLSAIEGGAVYLGPERREERRRECRNMRMEALLKNFGLDRRVDKNRRKADTSWLLVSKKVINQ